MPHPIDRHVGRRLRERREQRGMTQKQLADRLGISFQQIQKYEVADNRIGASRLWQICGVLKVAPDYFFEGLGNTTPRGRGTASAAARAEGPDAGAGREVAELNRQFQRIGNRALRRRLVQLVKAISR